MAMLSAAALLDELMGVDRDRAPNEKKTALHWSDPQVVIMYLGRVFSSFLWKIQSSFLILTERLIMA